MTSKIANTSYSRVDQRAAWLPGIFHNIPLQGFAALIGSILAYAAAVAVLVVSDGQPTSHWKVQPAVFLTIFYTLNNILIRIALKEGADVLWWTKALSQKATLSDLHHTWETGNSAFAALKKPTFGLISIASLAVSLTAINGPFLQRATRSRLESTMKNVNIGIRIASELPDTWSTAFVGGRGDEIAILTTNFTSIVQNFTIGTDITVEPTGCIGTCTAVVPGAGFAVKCTESEGPSFNSAPIFYSNGTVDTNTPHEIFSTAVTSNVWRNSTSSLSIGNVQVAFKNTTDCFGNLQIRNCTLEAATVQFPVTISHNKTGNGRDTISLSPSTTILDDAVIRLIVTSASSRVVQARGIYFALSNAYTSSAEMTFEGAIN
jgi:hypothetical protein